MSEIRYTDKEANEKGFFFRINGRNCKIMSYKGTEEYVVIPDYINGKPVRTIGRRAFMQKNIKGICLPDTLRVIREEAFRRNGFTEVELPAGIERIEKRAFDRCMDLRNVTIKGNTNKKNLVIGEDAFGGSPYVFASKFTILGNILIDISTGLNDKNLRIPNGVRVIGCEAMPGNWEVKRIEIPETVERIDDRAFAKAYRCEEVALDKPEKYIEMGEDIFGKVRYYGNNFAWRVVEQELVSWNDKKSGWKTFENFSVNLMQRHIWKVALYVPQCNADKFWEELKITYLYDFHKGQKLIPYMEGQTYYILFKDCDVVRDKIQMAESILMNYMGGKEIMEEALLYLSEHINKAIEYVIVHNKKDTLLLYEKFELLKEKESMEDTKKSVYDWQVKFQGRVRLNLRHMKYLMEKYENEAGEYLRKFL